MDLSNSQYLLFYKYKRDVMQIVAAIFYQYLVYLLLTMSSDAKCCSIYY